MMKRFLSLLILTRLIIIFFFTFWELNAQVAVPTFQAFSYVGTEFALYSFSSHTFTNCGATGTDGPTLSNCTGAYSPSWTDNTNYFNMTTQGYQRWTVPTDGTYTIEVYGARGGNTAEFDGGYGAKMVGDFNLNEGDILQILVGQHGVDSPNTTIRGQGGGGGTFVVKSDNTIYIIAGGGGGAGGKDGDARGFGRGVDGTTNTSGTNDYPNIEPKDDYTWGGTTYIMGVTAPGSGGGEKTDGGTNGYGGGGGVGGGGGGFYDNGGAGQYGIGGRGFLNDGLGGEHTYSFSPQLANTEGHRSTYGGFGGGGGTHWYGTGAGGGGYSGGGSGTISVGNVSNSFGGGGGSYNNGSSQNNAGGNNNGHGKVIITKQ